MRTKKTILLIAIFTLSSLAVVKQSSANFSVFVSINDAYYGDFDADTYEDDVGMDLLIELYNNRVYTDIDIYIGITLPSGAEFWFLIEFTAQKDYYYGYINMHFDALNTALESGWYDASAVGFAGKEKFSIMETLTFDPPGGHSPGEPTGRVTFT